MRMVSDRRCDGDRGVMACVVVLRAPSDRRRTRRRVAEVTR